MRAAAAARTPSRADVSGHQMDSCWKGSRNKPHLCSSKKHQIHSNWILLTVLLWFFERRKLLLLWYTGGASNTILQYFRNQCLWKVLLIKPESLWDYQIACLNTYRAVLFPKLQRVMKNEGQEMTYKDVFQDLPISTFAIGKLCSYWL